MHIIQIQTIGAWKGAREWSGKPWSYYLVNSHAFYKEWTNISRKCVAIVNHKHVVYWVKYYTKMKYMLGKTWRLVWCHGMTSPCPSKNVVMHAFHKTNHHRGSFMVSRGYHQDWRGIQISFVLCPWVFFSTMNIHPANHRVQIWNFSGFIYHI